MKGGLGPLNTTAALQNPYCSVYTIDESIFNNPDGEARQYALRTAYNGTVAEAYYQYAAGHPLATANSTLSAATALGANVSSVGQNNRNRRLMQAGTKCSDQVYLSPGSVWDNASKVQLLVFHGDPKENEKVSGLCSAFLLPGQAARKAIIMPHNH